MSKKDGFDGKKRMGNSAIKGIGANSPAMMEARKGFAKAGALKKKTGSVTPPTGMVNRLEGFISRKTGKRHYDVAGMTPEERSYHKKNKGATHRGELK